MIELYTDGSCAGNPGKGGWAVVAVNTDLVIWQDCGCEADTTNNRMEMMGVIKALEWARQNDQYTKFTLLSDSAYVLNCLEQGWYKKWRFNGWRTSKKEPVLNQDLWEELLAHYEALSSAATLKITKVKGHVGNYYNEMVDKMAVGVRSSDSPATVVHQD